MSRSTLRPVIKLRSTAGTGYTYVTRKSRRNDPGRLVMRKYDPVTGRHVEFRATPSGCWPARARSLTDAGRTAPRYWE